jgi:hypothetical protein
MNETNEIIALIIIFVFGLCFVGGLLYVNHIGSTNYTTTITIQDTVMDSDSTLIKDENGKIWQTTDPFLAKNLKYGSRYKITYQWYPWTPMIVSVVEV